MVQEKFNNFIAIVLKFEQHPSLSLKLLKVSSVLKLPWWQRLVCSHNKLCTSPYFEILPLSGKLKTWRLDFQHRDHRCAVATPHNSPPLSQTFWNTKCRVYQRLFWQEFSGLRATRKNRISLYQYASVPILILSCTSSLLLFLSLNFWFRLFRVVTAATIVDRCFIWACI